MEKKETSVGQNTSMECTRSRVSTSETLKTGKIYSDVCSDRKKSSGMKMRINEGQP